MRKLIIAGCVVLAACGGDAPSQDEGSEAINEAAGASTDSVDMNGGPALVVPQPGNNASEPAPAEVIPAALRGRWGLVPADCTSTRGDAKGLLTISDTKLDFYESVGTLRDVVESDESRIVADFDFMGEGQTWERRMTLDAQDDGRTLVRRESGADAMPGALRYTRCEA
jgi:hypothetical protein